MKIAYKSKKFLKNILSLAGLDNKRTVIGFYNKKQERGRRIGFCSNS